MLLPTYTFTATAEVVTYFGARPVLCDSVAGGFNIDPADVERRITEKTRAIMPVHVAGEPCAMDRLQAIAADSRPARDRGCRARAARQLSGQRRRHDLRTDRLQFLRY